MRTRRLALTLIATLAASTVATPAVALEPVSHVVPVVLALGGDTEADVAGLVAGFAHEVGVVDDWYASEHPNGKRLDLLRDADGDPAVIVAELDMEPEQRGEQPKLSAYAQALRDRGYISGSEAPLMLSPHPSPFSGMCGVGGAGFTSTGGEDVQTGADALVWLDSCDHQVTTTNDSLASSFADTVAHEVGHMMGAVTCNGQFVGHVDDERDLMRAASGPGSPLPRLDPGRDDYFRVSDPDCLDIDDSPLWEGRSVTAGGREAAPPVELYDTSDFCVEPGPSFSDVPDGGTFEPTIRCLTGTTQSRAQEPGPVILGYDDGTFRPALRVRRGQLAVIIVRGLANLGHVAPAGDMPCGEGTEIARALSVLVREGVAQSCDGRPRATRGNVARWLDDALLELAGIDLPASADDRFGDAAGPPEDLAAAGILQGLTPTTFGPSELVTRGQLTSIMTRYLAYGYDNGA